MASLEDRLLKLEQALGLGALAGTSSDLADRLTRLEGLVNRMASDQTIGSSLFGHPAFGGDTGGQINTTGIEFKKEGTLNEKAALTGSISDGVIYMLLQAQVERVVAPDTHIWDESAFIKILASNSEDSKVIVSLSSAGVGMGPATAVLFTFQPDGFLLMPGLALQDGLVAPGAIVGSAQIYVDAADGDLKVKFGDGTVKTLATDT